jgi:hypothetical protein
MLKGINQKENMFAEIVINFRQLEKQDWTDMYYIIYLRSNVNRVIVHTNIEAFKEGMFNLFMKKSDTSVIFVNLLMLLRMV